jgi:23S rRNA (uridine2552-2'-O)-methyltransferase
VLKPGGAFVAKAFQGGETADGDRAAEEALRQGGALQAQGQPRDSSEVFLVATGFKGR